MCLFVNLVRVFVPVLVYACHMCASMFRCRGCTAVSVLCGVVDGKFLGGRVYGLSVDRPCSLKVCHVRV